MTAGYAECLSISRIFAHFEFTNNVIFSLKKNVNLSWKTKGQPNKPSCNVPVAKKIMFPKHVSWVKANKIRPALRGKSFKGNGCGTHLFLVAVASFRIYAL